MTVDIICFFIAFFGMEWVANITHKYVMHGFLWNLHEDHHVIRKDRAWQKNDFFAFFFSTQSIIFIFMGTQWGYPALAGLGFGITAYGFVYFVVHEVVIHRRWRWFNFTNSYVEAITRAHRDHHRVRSKEGADNFGMLVPPLKYFLKEKVSNTQ